MVVLGRTREQVSYDYTKRELKELGWLLVNVSRAGPSPPPDTYRFMNGQVARPEDRTRDTITMNEQRGGKRNENDDD